MTNKYKRILLKISGEALAGGKGTGLDLKLWKALRKLSNNATKQVFR